MHVLKVEHVLLNCDLLIETQFGFMKGRSWVGAVQHIVENGLDVFEDHSLSI